MARRTTTDAYGPLRGPRALNPTLAWRLGLVLGRVELSNQGERAVFGAVRVHGGQVRRELVVAGEYYRVCCPYCGDRRHRLYVNHLWCQPDPVSDEPMRHLAICYNADCLKEHYGDFESRVLDVWDTELRAMAMAREAVRLRPATDESLATIGPVDPPGEIVPVDQLDPGHAAARYLAGRGFDLGLLGREWEVGLVHRAGPLHPAMARRIYIPVRVEGDVVGWQGRHVGDDWKEYGVPKYFTRSGFPKGRVLYGGDAAAARRAVVVVEGASDVWAYGPGAVATFGKTVSAEQLRLLGAWADRGGLAVLMFDPGAWTEEVPEHDRAKAEGRRDLLVGGLRSRFDGRAVEVALPPGRDPGGFARGPLRELVASAARDAGFDPATFGL